MFSCTQQLVLLAAPFQVVEWVMYKCGLTWSKLIGGIIATTLLGIVALEYFYPEPTFDDDDDNDDGQDEDDDE